MSNDAIAAGAVTFLLTKVTDYLEREVRHLTGIRRKVENLRDEFERMKASLRVADQAAEEVRNDLLKLWVWQVSEVVYDTENILDEFVRQFSNPYGDGFNDALCKTIRSIKKLRARHHFASAMRDIKSRIRDSVEMQTRFRHQTTIVPLPRHATASDPWYHPTESTLLHEVELEGIEEPKRQLIEWLVSRDSNCKVIAVFGRAGLGKTALVKEVYNDSQIKKRFQHHAWITVSRSLSIQELMKELTLQLYAEIKRSVPQDIDTMNSHGRLNVHIKDFLRQRRYVVVLDDLPSTDAWTQIKAALPNNNYGSRVMLTTRNTTVASACCRESQGLTYSLQPLSLDDSYSLFSKMILIGNPYPPVLEEISKRILRKCEGLPLAISIISGVLARRDVEEWVMIDRSLGALLENNSGFERVKEILVINFDDLPYNLKYCFLYTSIFPGGYLIERMRLIRLWVSEGMVKAAEGMSLEEVADNYLRELLHRNLIQVAWTTSDGRPKMLRIYDLMREILITRSKYHNLATIAKDNTIQWPEKVRRLSVHHTLPNLPGHKTLSTLRSLLMFGVRDPLPQSCILFSRRIKLLKVLDLQGAPNLENFPEAIVNFFHLRYLSLRDTRVSAIPSSIEKLENLETLDLKRAYVTRLPVEILKLQRLRHLLVYSSHRESDVPFHSKQGFKALPDIGKLHFLQKLCFVEADQPNSSTIINHLGELNQLRRLGILKLRREDGRALSSAIERLRNLLALSITSIDADEKIDLNDITSPPTFLQRLYLTGRLESLPQWISCLDCLVKLFLKWSHLSADPLESLQNLPNLVHLEFLQAYDGRTLHFKSEKFRSLKVLSLDKLQELRSVIVDKGAMPNLEKISIQRCSELRKLPSGMEYLTNIKVRFFDIPEENQEQVIRPLKLLIVSVRPDFLTSIFLLMLGFAICYLFMVYL